MKKIAFLAALAATTALAACSGSNDEAAAPAPEETTVAAAPTALDGGPLAGTYEVTGSDGTKLTQTLGDDGTVTTTAEDGTVANGTYTGSGAEGDPWCITNEGETEATCYNETMVDGTWTSTNTADPEDVWTVVRVADAAPAADATADATETTEPAT